MPSVPDAAPPPRGPRVTIDLVPPDPRWPEQFAAVADRIGRALGPVAVAIEHVGSTSVPGLAAKPFLDVLLLVPDPADEAAYLPALEALGFRVRRREPEWHEHRFLTTSAPVVQVHVFAVGNGEAERMLLFRDRLRTDEADRTLYERTKRRLAARSWEDVEDYADAKSEVVEAIVARARAGSA